MTPDAHDIDDLVREHLALMRDHGRAQARCSEALRAQAREIDRLQAQAMRLRAEVMRRDTALAWAREDREALERAIPGLPRRVTLARRVDALVARVQSLVRERSRTAPAPAVPRPVDADALEASLRAADLVICQTGCQSHGAFWRVRDHCRRTGKACVLVAQPEALRIVRLHAAPDGHARLATLEATPPR